MNIIEKGRKNYKTILFLHGFMGSSMDFTQIISALGNDYHCAALDLPGHGESLFQNLKKLKSLKSFDELSQLIINDLDSLGIKNFSLYGYSMGGRIAQSISLLIPERINKMILESSSSGIEHIDEREKRYKSDLQLFNAIKTESEFRSFLDSWHKLPIFKSLYGSKHISLLIESKIKNNINELKEAIKIMSIGNQEYYPHLLNDSNVCINYIFGEMDKKYAGIANSIKKIIPGMKMYPFKNASHNVHVEFPKEVVATVMSILDT